MRCALVCLVLLATSTPARADVRLCGWLENPTPGNWWLIDARGEWTISEQGGHEARGIERLPQVPERQWVETNGHYGYGCACLRVAVNRSQHRIVRVLSGKALPLRTCRTDRRLPEP